MEGSYSQSYEFYQEKEQINKGYNDIPNIQKQLLKHVLTYTQPGDLKGIIDCIDKFCQKYWMMNVGPQKSVIVNKQIHKHQPKKILELGGYCGYSSLIWALNSPQDAIVYTVQISQNFAEIARKIQTHAGVDKKTQIIVGTVQKRADRLKQIGVFDFIFIDHHKGLYLSDYQKLVSYGCIKKGTIVVGDNIIYPGCPDYLKNFQTTQVDKYKSILYFSHLQYSNMKDAVLVSQRII